VHAHQPRDDDGQGGGGAEAVGDGEVARAVGVGVLRGADCDGGVVGSGGGGLAGGFGVGWLVCVWLLSFVVWVGLGCVLSC
jgi:hypothetical protein